MDHTKILNRQELIISSINDFGRQLILNEITIDRLKISTISVVDKQRFQMTQRMQVEAVAKNKALKEVLADLKKKLNPISNEEVKKDVKK